MSGNNINYKLLEGKHMKLTKRRGNSGSMDTLRRDMDLFFEDLIPFSWTRDMGGKELRGWTPSSDISENENEYTILMDIPGMEKDAIKINYQDKRITITGDRKLEEKEEDDDFIRRERYEGSFYRSFTLAETVKEDKIHASFKDGVLKLVIPKAEVVKPKTIKVN